MKKLIILLLAFVVSVSMVSIVYADEDIESVSDASSTALSQDVEVEIPSGFGLLWQDVRERVSLMFTFDPVDKAEKRIMYAERRMEMAQQLVANESEALQQRGQHMIERAEQYMARVEQKKETWVQKAEERTERIAQRIGDYQEHREYVMDILENTAPEDRAEAIQALREEFSAQGTRLLNALDNENIPEQVREHLTEVKERIETHAQEVQVHRERVQELKKEKPSVDVDPEIQQIREERREHVQERVEQHKLEQPMKQLNRKHHPR